MRTLITFYFSLFSPLRGELGIDPDIIAWTLKSGVCDGEPLHALLTFHFFHRFLTRSTVSETHPHLPVARAADDKQNGR